MREDAPGGAETPSAEGQEAWVGVSVLALINTPCDLGQVIAPACASVSLLVRQGQE